LRNPLAAIGGFSKLISSKDYPEDKLKEYTRIILEQSLRLDNAVNEVLIHLKVGGGQV
jgi:signal transduction histidine kinase